MTDGLVSIIMPNYNCEKFIDETIKSVLAQTYDAGWSAETSVESIAGLLQKVIEEERCFEIKSQAAIRLIEENFEWSKVAQETVEKYRTIIRR